MRRLMGFYAFYAYKSLSKTNYITLVSCYAPTMTNPDEAKEEFYEELDRLLASINRSDKVLVLGDFNARVGTDFHTWPGVLGHHGTGRCNSNGLMLLSLYAPSTS